MNVYELPKRERASRRLEQAADLAWDYLGNTLYFRIQQSRSVAGAIPKVSLEEAQRRAGIGADLLYALVEIDRELLTHEESLTYGLLEYYANNWAKAAEAYWLAYDVTGVNFPGPFVQTAYNGGFAFNFIAKALGSFTFSSDSDVDCYLGILADIVRLLQQIHERTQLQAERGIRVNKPQIPGVKGLLNGLRATAQAAYRVEPDRLRQLPRRDSYCEAIASRVDNEVVPAFDDLIAQLDVEYESLAPPEVGIDKLPGGGEVYLDLLKMHTTMDMTPEDVHQSGLFRLERIAQQKAEIREKLGFEGTEQEFAVHLRQQPGAVASSAEDIGEKMRKQKDLVEARFDEFFSQRSPKDYDLERLDTALEGSMTWGYYQAATDEEPVGKYLYNGSKLDSQAVLGAASLVFHELVPGHHLHLTLQAANDDLHPVRRYAFVNAFNEGWAEYAATLTGEMGLYDDPYDQYGRCIMDAFLTTRLVVDTGMNYLGWSLERAKDFMAEHTLCVDTEIESECLRYSCGIPAQSLAYKLGDEEILRVRQELMDEWGEDFNYPAFHSAILGVGGLPLPLLESHLKTVFSRQVD